MKAEEYNFWAEVLKRTAEAVSKEVQELFHNIESSTLEMTSLSGEAFDLYREHWISALGKEKLSPEDRQKEALNMTVGAISSSLEGRFRRECVKET